MSKRRPGRPVEGKEKKVGCSYSLPQEIKQIAYLMGDSNGSIGVERLFSGLPVFHQVKAAIALAASGQSIPQDLAQVLLEELESLEIDRVYEEAVAEGLLSAKKEPLIF